MPISVKEMRELQSEFEAELDEYINAWTAKVQEHFEQAEETPEETTEEGADDA